MEANFWIKKWQDGETRFHQSSFHPELVKFGSKITAHTVLLPLCGKTLDLLYFASRGHQVIGVELSPLACKDFFKENDIVYKEKTMDEWVVYESAQVTLWCGDFFALPSEVWSQVGAIYDRAALVALPLEMRQRYTREIIKRTRTSFQMLLIAYEYAQEKMAGPPFSVSTAEIEQSYAGLNIQLLHSFKDDLKGLEATESVYWVERIE